MNGPPVKEALKTTYANKWKKTIDVKYNQLLQKRVFEETEDLPEGKKAIGSKIVLKEKLNKEGRHSKFKACIVAQGFSQIPGVDYGKTFLSVAKCSLIQIFLTLAAVLDLEIHQIDVIRAYLEGSLDEDIYMKAPDGIGKKRYWKLLKALYGLKQAGRKWKEKLHGVLTKHGFEQIRSDDCIYVLRSGGKIILYILVYVDDIIIAGKDIEEIISFKNKISEDFDVTDLGKIHFILGIQVVRDCSDQYIYLNQSAYIDSILNRFEMTSCSPVSTPIATNHHLSRAQTPCNQFEQEEYERYARGTSYISLVGSLLYATQTRPDIQFAVGLTAQFAGNPGIPHLSACKRIL